MEVVEETKKEKKEKKHKTKEKKEKKKHKHEKEGEHDEVEENKEEKEMTDELKEKYKRLEKEVEEDIEREEKEEEIRVTLILKKKKEEEELKMQEELKKQEQLKKEESKIVQEEKESLITTNIKIKADLKESSDEEIDDISTKFMKTVFNINSKYANRMLVYKLNCREKLNVYQGEVQRIKKRMGILTSKQSVYMCINRDRINLYKIPLTAIPMRQFLFDLEKMSIDTDKNDPSVIRLFVNNKEYVFKIESEEIAQKWCNFVQKAIQKTIEEEGESEALKGKTWKEPHITEKRFLREANTFDLLQFKAHGVKTLGVILQIIDKDSDYNLLYKSYPEILYYDPQTKMVTVRSFEELKSTSKVFFYPLLNYDCDEESLETADKMIVDSINDSKENTKYNIKEFGSFIQKLYINCKIVTQESALEPVKLRFKYVFDSKSTSYVRDCYFENPHKVIFTADK